MAGGCGSGSPLERAEDAAVATGPERWTPQRVAAWVAAVIAVAGAFLGPVSYSVARTEKVEQRVSDLRTGLEQHQSMPDAATERRLQLLEAQSMRIAEQVDQIARDVAYLRGRAEAQETRRTAE